MYENHFGFRQLPFSLTPDPRFLFLSAHHREALAHLLFGVGEGGGFVQLTGEVGTGKTTLCRSVLEQVPERVDLALVFNPRLTPAELVATVCDELGAPYPADTQSIKTLVDSLTRRLLKGYAAGRRAVVVIDEAQNLDADALEQIRLLTNLETPTQKLLQIVLIGQPELQQLMARPDLRQLAQRITARYHLPPLSRHETTAYVRHRLQVAGGSADLFAPAALRLLHNHSSGVPRVINILCDRALLGAYARGANRVNPALVRAAAREVAGEQPTRHRPRVLVWGTALVAVALVTAAVTHRSGLWQRLQLAMSSPATPAPAQSQPESPPPTATSSAVAAAPTPAPIEPSTSAKLTPRDLLGLLDEGIGDGPITPLRELLGLWALATPEHETDICAVAAAGGLQCFRSRGNWTQLLALDRPAVLHLRDPAGQEHLLLITGMDGEDLLWFRNGETMRLPRSAVDPLWYGTFTMMWRPPPGGTLVLGDGSEGRDVVWLAERLAELDPGETAAPLPTRFNGTLEQRVRDVQRRFGLVPDGVAGRETIMHLNAAADPLVPRLTP